MKRSTHVLLLGATFLAAAFAWSMYCPVPDGFSETWPLRKLHIYFKTTVKVARWLDYIGWKDLGDVLDEAFAAPKAHLDGVEAVDVDVDGVPIRIRTPRDRPETKPFPACIFYHGGAYIIGDRYTHDRMLHDLALELSMVVISVSYRLAPRALWPAQHEDAMTVAKYFLEHGAEYGIDTHRVALAGDSAGGHLAAAVSLKLRDDGYAIRPKVQCLIYPVCQFLDFRLPSHMQNPDGPILTRELVLFSVSNLIFGNDSIVGILDENEHVTSDIIQAVGSNIKHGHVPVSLRYAPYSKRNKLTNSHSKVSRYAREILFSPYFSVLVAEDLSDQPTTFVFTAMYDVLRDDGILYADALRRAGNDVTYVNHPRGIHGMMRFYNSLPEGRDFYEALVTFLRNNL